MYMEQMSLVCTELCMYIFLLILVILIKFKIKYFQIRNQRKLARIGQGRDNSKKKIIKAEEPINFVHSNAPIIIISSQD